jgi:hypothetical protein
MEKTKTGNKAISLDFIIWISLKLSETRMNKFNSSAGEIQQGFRQEKKLFSCCRFIYELLSDGGVI